MSFPFVVVTPGQEAAGQVSQITSQDTYASVGAPLTVIGSGGGGGPTVIPANLVVSTLNAATSVSTSVVNAVSLLNVSTINGAAYVPGGGVPANLTVSTLTAADTINSATLRATGGGTDDELGIVVGTNPVEGGISLYMCFNSGGQDTAAAGQLAILKGDILTSVSKTGTNTGLAVFAFSTILGSFQPVGCSDIYVYEKTADNSDGRKAFMLESVNNPVSSLNLQAPNVNISSLLGVSSINGINFARISTVIAAAP